MSKAKLTFANQTLREIVHVSIGGSLVRVRLSNVYGKEAVQIGAAHIALRKKGATRTCIRRQSQDATAAAWSC